MIRLGVLGPTGRMGQEVLRQIEKDYVARVEIVIKAGRADPPESLLPCEAVVEFAGADGLEAVLAAWKKVKTAHRPVLISGSTGLTESAEAARQVYSQLAPVLATANFSLGMALMKRAMLHVGEPLRRLGFEAAIEETHHIHKKDRPSGTALMLARSLSADAGYFDLPITAHREGEVVGIHSVRFKTPAETVEFTHQAHDRSLFARGAIESAIWLVKRRRTEPALAGLFTLDEFLDSL